MSDALDSRALSTLLEGRPFPLGATVEQHGINFAVFSAHAETIDLCLFDANGTTELQRLPLPVRTGDIWHGFLPGACAGQVYGYRAHGPFDPDQGARFNAQKLLIDPYARLLIGPTDSLPILRGDAADTPNAPGSTTPDPRDSAPFAPKAKVASERFDWSGESRPKTPLSQSVIYEAHVRGISMLRTDLDAQHRGTFAALADPCFINHLQTLGVTAIELLPVHAILHDRFLLEAGLSNYWGYNTIGYFAVNPEYLSSGSLNEVRAAIKAFHAAGIEVILDVVYNHTGEGDERGPTVAFRGLDNVTYYRLDQNQKSLYVNDTGCGNTLDTAHPRVIELVMDSLRYWVTDMHVDGFRFDLAVTLGRDPVDFTPQSAFLVALLQDPVLNQVKLIAEPWDIGPNGYRLGQFPPGFSEWNDRFRDCVRRFWRGDEGQRGELATRLSASPDLFENDHRDTSASLNFVTAHDGFTLTDLVTYSSRHNLANGENNRDGSQNNYSSNWGDHDASSDPAVIALREQIKRALLTTLFMAHGVPMLLGGDEFGRSQSGNNNAYCQDSAISWVDWSLIETPSGKNLSQFVARLLSLRREIKASRSEQFMHGQTRDDGRHDTDWFDSDGSIISADSWSDPGKMTLCLRRIDDEDDTTHSMLLLLNASSRKERFVLPAHNVPWHARLCCADPQIEDEVVVDDFVDLAAHSAMVLSSVSPKDSVPQ